MTAPKRPSHNIVVVTKAPPRVYTKVGVAWEAFDGTRFNLSLNPGTVLDWRLSEDFYINLIPIGDSPYTASDEKDSTPDKLSDSCDEVPF